MISSVRTEHPAQCPYDEVVAERAATLRESGEAVVLAIESSCDETAASVVKNGRQILSNVVSSQIDTHRLYGGVVPEIASRLHGEQIEIVVSEALMQADCALSGIDAIAVTNGPGLVGCLLVGLSYAKGLSFTERLPLYLVQHIEGHIASNYIADPNLKPPFIALVASGGHSHIYAVDDYQTIRLLGATRDDAAGEAFDKAARALGLSYPGGPALEALAEKGNPQAFPFHSAFNDSAQLDLSFSGMKTALLNHIHNAEQRQETISYADLAASFQSALVQTLTKKCLLACQQSGYSTLTLAGGVAANKALRQSLQSSAEAAGLRFVCPPPSLCGDNAAMIGAAGYYALLQSEPATLSSNAQPGRRLASQ